MSSVPDGKVHGRKLKSKLGAIGPVHPSQGMGKEDEVFRDSARTSCTLSNVDGGPLAGDKFKVLRGQVGMFSRQLGMLGLELRKDGDLGEVCRD